MDPIQEVLVGDNEEKKHQAELIATPSQTGWTQPGRSHN